MAPETFSGNFPLYVLVMVVDSTVLKVLCCYSEGGVMRTTQEAKEAKTTEVFDRGK